MRSGATIINQGYFRNFGRTGYLWASSAAVYTDAFTADTYSILFNVAVMTSNGPNPRWNGSPSAAHKV